MSPESFEAMALRRVSEGGVTVAEGGYVHHGRPVTGEPAEALIRLHTAGCLTIGAPGPGGHPAGAHHHGRGRSGPPSWAAVAAAAERSP